MLNLKTLKTVSFTALAAATTLYAPVTFAGTQNATPAQAVEVAENQTIASGTFSGRSDHITSGKASIVKTQSGYELVLAENFSLDGAPDPIVGFGNNDKFEIATKVSKLTSKTGTQTYQLPASFTPGEFNQVFIFCEKFNVPLGVANLN